MYTVYDKDGKPSYHIHAVDAKEAVATGRFFLNSPKTPAPPPEPEPKLPVNEIMGEDIEDLKKTETEPEPEPEPEPEDGQAEGPTVEELEQPKKRKRQ